jgi:hypothetical protein
MAAERPMMVECSLWKTLDIKARWAITNSINILKGTVHGKTIELEQEPGLPEGQKVSVTLLAAPSAGEGLRRSFGAWADDSAQLDEFLVQLREDRKRHRDGPNS